MAKDAIFSGEREVRTFVDLSHGANVFLKFAQQTEAGSYYTAMASLLLRAFTFEAYLNHLGAMKVDWAQHDRLPVMKKYKLLAKMFSISPDFSRRPYTTLSTLFSFRNAVAHGRTQVVKKSKDVSSEDEPYEHMPKAEHEEYATVANAELAKEDISTIITELHKAAGISDHPFMHGVGVGSVKLKPPRPESGKA